MKEIYGVIPPIVTIFSQNGEIDWQANYKHQDFLIDKGVNGIAYLGTTGEFYSLTISDKKEFLEKMVNHAKGRVPILAGVSDTCIANILEMIKWAEKIGIDGLLITPPYFSIYPSEMIEKFYCTIADKTFLPIILYNFPTLTGFNMSPEWVKNLALKKANIVGIKETVPDLGHVKKMMKIKAYRSDFKIFMAYDNQFLEGKDMGIDGFIHAAANYAPEAAVALWNEKKRSNWEQLYERVINAMKVYEVAQPLYLGVKEAVYFSSPNCS